MSKNPIQPLVVAESGVLRFKENAIVSYLLDFARKHGCDLNALACVDFNNDDRQQFAQLIGYSHDGYGSLSYSSDEVYDTAMAVYKDSSALEKDLRIARLEKELSDLRNALREPMSKLFCIHPDDLGGAE